MKVFVACVLMGLVLYYGVAEISQWETWSVYQRAWQLTLWVVAGGAMYFVALLLMGVKFKALLRHQ